MVVRLRVGERAGRGRPGIGPRDGESALGGAKEEARDQRALNEATRLSWLDKKKKTFGGRYAVVVGAYG